MTRIIFPTAISSGVLGFYRGTQLYNYEYNKNVERYNKNIEQYNKYAKDCNTYNISSERYRQPHFFYSRSFMNGLLGTFFYINPVLIPFFVTKEIYILEIYMRNDLNELKNQDEYYSLV